MTPNIIQHGIEVAFERRARKLIPVGIIVTYPLVIEFIERHHMVVSVQGVDQSTYWDRMRNGFLY